MNAIVSVTRDWGIGCAGSLIVRNRADMRYFVDCTRGGTVVMGSTTFRSLPGGPLKGRRNIVLSRYMEPAAGVELARSVGEALDLVATDTPKRVWCIGGEQVYAQLLPHCQRAYVTKNDVLLEADAFFPNLDQATEWAVEKRLGSGTTEDGVPFEFLVYKNLRLVDDVRQNAEER